MVQGFKGSERQPGETRVGEGGAGAGRVSREGGGAATATRRARRGGGSRASARLARRGSACACRGRGVRRSPGSRSTPCTRRSARPTATGRPGRPVDPAAAHAGAARRPASALRPDSSRDAPGAAGRGRSRRRSPPRSAGQAARAVAAPACEQQARFHVERHLAAAQRIARGAEAERKLRRGRSRSQREQDASLPRLLEQPAPPSAELALGAALQAASARAPSSKRARRVHPSSPKLG